MRQPNWKRWEVILLVALYFRLQNHPEKTAAECERLSKLLRRSNLDMALQSSAYRNVQGIRMKHQNIRYIVEGKGLSTFSKLDQLIVNYRNCDIGAFNDELTRILDCIKECDEQPSDPFSDQRS